MANDPFNTSLANPFINLKNPVMVAQAGAISSPEPEGLKSVGSAYRVKGGIITVRHVMDYTLDQIAQKDPQKRANLKETFNQESKYISTSFRGIKIGLDGKEDGAIFVPDSFLSQVPEMFKLFESESNKALGSVGKPFKESDFSGDLKEQTIKSITDLKRIGMTTIGDIKTPVKPGDSGSQLVNSQGEALYSAIIGDGGNLSYYIPNKTGRDYEYMLKVTTGASNGAIKVEVEPLGCMEALLGCA